MATYPTLAISPSCRVAWLDRGLTHCPCSGSELHLLVPCQLKYLDIHSEVLCASTSVIFKFLLTLLSSDRCHMVPLRSIDMVRHVASPDALTRFMLMWQRRTRQDAAIISRSAQCAKDQPLSAP